jgi:ribosomal protein L23
MSSPSAPNSALPSEIVKRDIALQVAELSQVDVEKVLLMIEPSKKKVFFVL